MTGTRLRWEVAIVLGLSLGASAVYSLVAIIARLTDDRPLAEQSATLNGSLSEREWLDFTYQFLGTFFQLFTVALVLYLLWLPGQSAFGRIGFDLTERRRDLVRGAGLVLVIGIPGLAFYLAGRAAGITVAVVTKPLDTFWWTIPILVFAALGAALSEEIVVVGYLFTRLREFGLSTWTVIVSSALLRGTYHLYQGIGPFVGNVALGMLFGWCYTRWGRTMPLVLAHWVLDIVSFVGYPLALAWWPGLLTPAT